MSSWKLNNHIVGKSYDLTQNNMNAMIADIERLVMELKLAQAGEDNLQRILESIYEELLELKEKM